MSRAIEHRARVSMMCQRLLDPDAERWLEVVFNLVVEAALLPAPPEKRWQALQGLADQFSRGLPASPGKGLDRAKAGGEHLRRLI